MFVKSTEGRKVRRPDTYALLPAEGGEVPRDEFWLRRLRDKDVELAQPPAAPVPAAAPAAVPPPVPPAPAAQPAPAAAPAAVPPAAPAPAAPHAS